METYIENRTFDELKVGQSATLEHRLTMEDLKVFAGAASLMNPGHMDQEFAGSELFQKVIAHGMWGTSLLATLLITEMPGPGTEFVEGNLRYDAPVALGDTLQVRVKIEEKRVDEHTVRLSCEARNDSGDQVFHGTVLVRAPKEKLRRPREEVYDPRAGVHRSHLQRLLALAAEPEPMRTAVVHPVDRESLLGVVEAAKHGLIDPVLIGPEAKIRGVAEKEGLDIGDYKLVPTEHSHEAAEKGVALTRAGDCEALMKGALHTDEFLHPTLDRNAGLRTARRMSHVWAMDVPTYPRPLFITDAAINIYPDLEAKRDIVQNAIDLAHVLLIREPKVALLSATESVNPKIDSTLDAAALCKMADRGQITGAQLDGPLAFDNAVSVAAAKTKHINSPVAGLANILVVPDLESGNMLAKQLHYLADAVAAGIVLGARVPIILTSRSDDTISRLASCALGLMLVHSRRKGA